MSLATSFCNGRFTAAKNDAALRPRIAQTRAPVIYCHSAAQDGSEALGLAQLPSIGPLMRTVGQDRLVAAPTIETLWGNTTAKQRITDAVTWAQANGASSAPVFLVGASMGACAALSWAYANPTQVAGLAIIIPAVDLEAIRTANTGGLRASIDTAYGVTYPASLPAGANPIDGNPGVPVQVWYASNDAVSANVTTWGATVGAEVHNLGALGHTDTAVAGVDAVALRSFVSDALG